MEKCNFVDILEIYKVDRTGHMDLLVKTEKHPSIFKRIKKALGLCIYADDRVTNAGLADIAGVIKDRYIYVGVGTNGLTTGQDTFTNLQTPIMTRVLSTGSLTTTYIANDTAQFLAIFTADADYTIMESALFTAATSGTMYCRQTNCNLDWANGTSYAVVWKIVCTR